MGTLPYFERVKKLSTYLFVFAGIGFFITIIQFLRYDFWEAFVFNYLPDVRAIVFSMILFLLSVFCLALGISLRYVAEDAKEYIDRVLTFTK